MILVLFLFFLGFIIVISFLILGILFSKIEINVKNITINTLKKTFETQIDIYIFWFQLVKIAKISIENKKISFNGIYLKNFLTVKKENKKIIKIIIYKILQDRIKNIIGKQINIFKNELLNDIKIQNIKPNIKKLKIDIQIGTEDVILTSFLVFVFSIIMNILCWNLLNKKQYENYKYFVNPNYCNVNQFSAEISSKININMIHILSFFELYIKIKKQMSRVNL